MRGVLAAEGAVLAGFHSFGMGFLILGHVIVTVLALGALQGKSGSLAVCHEFDPP